MQKAEKVFVVGVELTHPLFFGMFRHTHETTVDMKAATAGEAMLKVYAEMRFIRQAGDLQDVVVDVVSARPKV